MLSSVGKKSGESLESVLKKKGKREVARDIKNLKKNQLQLELFQ